VRARKKITGRPALLLSHRLDHRTLALACNRMGQRSPALNINRSTILTFQQISARPHMLAIKPILDQRRQPISFHSHYPTNLQPHKTVLPTCCHFYFFLSIRPPSLPIRFTIRPTAKPPDCLAPCRILYFNLTIASSNGPPFGLTLRHWHFNSNVLACLFTCSQRPQSVYPPYRPASAPSFGRCLFHSY